MATTDHSTADLPKQGHLDRFYIYCRHEITDLREQIGNLDRSSTINGEQASAIEHCQARIADFSQYVRNAASYLPAHDQRTYSEAVKALSEELEEKRASLIPRQKFSFKKKNASAISINDAAELAAKRLFKAPGYNSDSSAATSSFATTPAGLRSPAPELALDGQSEPKFAENDSASIRKPSFSQSSSIKISNHVDQHIILPSSASHATTQGTLSNLRSCVIDMSAPSSSAGAFASLTLKNITNSLIVCGHANGPAHLTGITDSTIVVTCRQFRMHESKNVDVYLLCTSRPIIEDCNHIRFAPLPKHYMKDTDREVINLFDQVDDFKWLKAEASPNWSILDPSLRIEDEVWTDVVPGKVGTGHDSILKVANVRSQEE